MAMLELQTPIKMLVPFDPSALSVINNNMSSDQLDDVIKYYQVKISQTQLKINKTRQDKRRLFTSLRYQKYNPLQRELYAFYVDNYDKIKANRSMILNGHVKLWKDDKSIHYKVYILTHYMNMNETGPNKIVEIIG
jgi:hypothetical protein